MNLILFQNAAEIKEAKALFGNRLRDLEIVAWTPHAVDGLRAEKLPFCTLADYGHEKYDSQRLFAELEEFRSWCELLDEYISFRVPNAKKYKMRPALNKLHVYRILFYVYFHEIDKLYEILKNSNASLVHYFSYPDSQNSILSQIMKVVEADNRWGASFNRLQPPAAPLKSVFPESGLVPYWYPGESILKQAAKLILKKTPYKSLGDFVSGLTRGMFPEAKESSVLVLSVALGFDKVLALLKQRGKCRLLFWDDIVRSTINPLAIPSDEIINDFGSDSQSRKWTTRHDIDFFELFVTEVTKFLSHEIPIMESIVKQFRILHEKNDLSLVVTSYELTGYEPIFDQCAYLNIPIVTFLHGGTVGLLDSPPIYLLSRQHKFTSRSYHCVYSKTIQDFCEKLEEKISGHTPIAVALGSPYFEQLLLKNYKMPRKAGDDIRICYVYGGIGYHNVFFKRGLYEDASLYKLRYTIAARLRNASGVSVTFKFGYDTEKYGLAFERELAQRKDKTLHFIPSSKKLVDFLADFDLFVIEMASTTLFELLCTQVPVIVLVDPRGTAITESAMELLRRRVTIVESDEELFNRMDEIILNRWNASVFNNPDHSDMRFIKEYATCGDSKGIERTCDFLQSIMSPSMKLR